MVAAAGRPGVKDDVRHEVWDVLADHGEAPFPLPPRCRIPDSKGAADAARILAATPWWAQAGVIKCDLDPRQRHVRKRALEEATPAAAIRCVALRRQFPAPHHADPPTTRHANTCLAMTILWISLVPSKIS